MRLPPRAQPSSNIAVGAAVAQPVSLPPQPPPALLQPQPMVMLHPQQPTYPSNGTPTCPTSTSTISSQSPYVSHPQTQPAAMVSPHGTNVVIPPPQPGPQGYPSFPPPTQGTPTLLPPPPGGCGGGAFLQTVVGPSHSLFSTAPPPPLPHQQQQQPPQVVQRCTNSSFASATTDLSVSPTMSFVSYTPPPRPLVVDSNVAGTLLPVAVTDRGNGASAAGRDGRWINGSLDQQIEFERRHLCCFYLQGNCKFGARCRFLHIPSNRGESSGLTCQFGPLCRAGHMSPTIAGDK